MTDILDATSTSRTTAHEPLVHPGGVSARCRTVLRPPRGSHCGPKGVVMTDILDATSTSRTTADEPLVHYHVAGAGPPLVMLHGSGPGVSGWSNFGALLPELRQQFQVVIIDQPGYGQSYIPVLDRPYGR